MSKLVSITIGLIVVAVLVAFRVFMSPGTARTMWANAKTWFQVRKEEKQISLIVSEACKQSSRQDVYRHMASQIRSSR